MPYRKQEPRPTPTKREHPIKTMMAWLDQQAQGLPWPVYYTFRGMVRSMVILVPAAVFATWFHYHDVSFFVVGGIAMVLSLFALLGSD